MAMSKCKECGRAVSTLAKSCPRCGAPDPTHRTSTSKSSSKSRASNKRDSSEGIQGFVLDHWNGNFPLAKSFWMVGVLLNFVFGLPFVYAQLNIDTMSDGAATFFLIYVAFWVAFFVWVNVGIWKSSSNYIASKKNSPFWGWAARVVVVLSVVRAIGETFVSFMQ